MLRFLTVVALLAPSAPAAEGPKSVLLAESRDGIVEFLDPATLEIIGRMHIRLPPQSVGLSGIAASADGSTLYVEGPIPGASEGCCVLYAVDLATLRAKQAASIPGSRGQFVFSDGIAYPTSALVSNADMDGDRLHLSPDRRRLIGVRNFRGPAIDFFDLAREGALGHPTPDGLDLYRQAVGTWSGDRFYLYANDGEGSARLWTISPDAARPGTGVSVALPAPGCSSPVLNSIAAAAGRLLLYEAFGFTTDRRSACGQMPGGAWFVDPATGALTGLIAPDLHFSALVSDRAGTALFGLSVEALLVRLDPDDGHVLKIRPLDPGFWRIAVADIRDVPAGDVRVEPEFGRE